MNSTPKSQILSILSADVQPPNEVTASDEMSRTCVLIDGHALIQALGKPSKCSSFNDYAHVFVGLVKKHFKGGATIQEWMQHLTGTSKMPRSSRQPEQVYGFKRTS